MPTIQQLIRKPRQPKKRGAKNPALKANPQKRGVCTRVYTTTPLFSCAAAALVTSQVSVTQSSVVASTHNPLKIVKQSVPNMVLSARSKPSLHIKNKEPSQRCGGFFVENAVCRSIKTPLTIPPPQHNPQYAHLAAARQCCR